LLRLSVTVAFVYACVKVAPDCTNLSVLSAASVEVFLSDICSLDLGAVAFVIAENSITLPTLSI
jgi:hypothetical protein